VSDSVDKSSKNNQLQTFNVTYKNTASLKLTQNIADIRFDYTNSTQH
jgi:hypothetical protein